MSPDDTSRGVRRALPVFSRQQDGGNTMTRVGFIGIGTMGTPMAANLVRKGFAVTLYDAAPGRATQVAAELGCAAAASLAELAGCEFILTMLPDGKVVQEVLTRAEGQALL